MPSMTPHDTRHPLPEMGRSSRRARRWRPWPALLLAVLGLAACGGGTGDELPSPLSPVQAVDLLMAAPRAYPAALAVRVTTGLVEVRVHGVQHADGAALRGNEAFPMGSLTKSMTATLAGVLVQDGRIGWDSRLLDVLPELRGVARAEYASVNLRDLLSHRGGLFPATTAEQIAQLPATVGTPTEQRAQLAAWMLQQPSVSRPGLATQYSNGDYIVAGALLERVAAQPYETVLQARVFAPLGATVRFGTPGTAIGEPWGHAAATGAAWQPVDPASPDAQFPSAGHPAGGAKLDAAALGRYLQMHLRAYRGIGSGLLTPATARALHTVVQEGVALGWEAGRDLAGGAVHWHNGSDEASYYGLMAMSLEADVASAVVVTGYSARSEADASEATVRMLR